MKTLNLEQMCFIKGGNRATPEFVVMCTLLSAGLGLITFGLGAVAGFGCWALANL
jgi:hypothetical protein